MALKDLFKDLEKGNFTLSETELAQRAIEEIPEDKLLKKIEEEFEYLVECQKSSNLSVLNLSWVLAMKIPGDKLARKLEYLMECRKSDNLYVRDLSWALAMKIPGDKLARKLEYLMECRKSDNLYVRDLTEELILIVKLPKNTDIAVDVKKIKDLINK